jgi:hypothetical protein
MRTVAVFEVRTSANVDLWEWALLAPDGVGSERVTYAEPGPAGKQVPTPGETIMARELVFAFQVRDSAVKP